MADHKFMKCAFYNLLPRIKSPQVRRDHGGHGSFHNVRGEDS